MSSTKITTHTIADDHEQPLFGFHWSAGIGQPAGMFWFGGRCIIAGYGTRAEEWLTERGAVAVGTLRFGRDPVEGTVPGATVTPVTVESLVRAAMP